MRSKGIFLLLILGTLSAYYIYSPIPDEIEERWKLMVTDCFFRSLSHLASLCELLGLKDYMEVMMLLTFLEKVVPVSDANVRVTEELFDGVEVLIYEPSQQAGHGELRRAVIYLHGGGWCLGSVRMAPYDLLASQTASELSAVVVSVEYRLAQEHHFPVPFEDVYRVVKHFLQPQVLAQYSVDPGRVAVSGDSAGGNLAAAVAQQLLQDPDQQVALKAQALLYPVLQALDLNTPSYQQNRVMPILTKTLMVRFWSQYFSSDKALFDSMMANSHNSLESADLLKFVNWSDLLPKSLHEPYKYKAPVVERSDLSRSMAAIADLRASPLLAPDSMLQALPNTYVLTCEYDVLRDDGFMYVTRLQRAGVNVTHEHYSGGFHGALLFILWPSDFEIAHKMIHNYIHWLRQNL